MPNKPTITETLYALADMVMQFGERHHTEGGMLCIIAQNDAVRLAMAVLKDHGCHVLNGRLLYAALLRYMADLAKQIEEEDAQCN